MSARLVVEALLREEEARADAVRVELEPASGGAARETQSPPDMPYGRCSNAVKRWWRNRKPGAPVTSIEIESLAQRIRKLAR